MTSFANMIRIPGKVMLSGEYLVLEGAPAAMAPVPRYLTLHEAAAGLRTDASPVVQAARAVPIPEVREYEDEHGVPGVLVDRSELTLRAGGEGPAKLGLGSSACEAVGVVALRMQRAGLDWTRNRERITRLAFQAHREAQGGLGSGADVAVAAWGAPLIYRLEQDQPSAELAPGKSALPLALFWTGQPADTRALVRAWQRWRRREASEELVARVRAAAEPLAGAWFTEDGGRLLEALRAYDAVMEEMMNAAGVDWKLPLHRELARWAEENGGWARPTGAGGGDLVLLVGDLPHADLFRQDAFAGRAQMNWLIELPLEGSAPGTDPAKE